MPTVHLVTAVTALLLGPLALAQSASTTSSTSAQLSSSSKGDSSADVMITTITSLASATSSGASALPTTLVLTLTLNSSGFPSNATLINGTTANGTSTNATVPWNGTDQYLPFHVAIDPAYGTLGGLLSISGLPVAMLGEKNRSSLAIVSAYSVMLFTLVLVLRFGVEPNLQPPSPNPPSTTLRGLYLLACIISSFFGAAIGVFFFTFAKYWVSAAGGFAFGWFLLATRHGGLVSSTLGRWGLLGSLTVATFVASLVPVLTRHMTLVSTAWIGATASLLGVDCFVRGGLKEFYIYNLGFHDLFPSLNGLKYPLTQTMEIELGILAAVVIIGAAIQFRLLNMLQNRLKQLRDEEEARIEAEEVSKAAERFKDVGSELNEWEEKHGNGTSGTSVQGASGGPVTPHNRSSVALPQLGFTEDRRLSSESLLPAIGDRGAYDIVPLSSPTLLSADAPTTGRFSMMDSLKSPDAQVATALTDPELEDKIRLLAEVKRAREEVKGSLDKLRSSNPTPSMTGLLAETPGMTTPSPGGSDFASTHPRLSVASSRMLDYPERSQTPNQGEWEAYLQERKVLSRPALPSPALLASSAVASAPSSQHSQYAVISDGCGRAAERRERTTSMLEPRASDFGSRQSRGMSNTYPSSSIAMRKTASFKDWPSTFHDVPFGQPIILGSAARPMEPTTSNRPKQQRTMTYDELAERHRKRISQLQEPVTAKMREQVDVAEAKAKWEQQKRRERNEQQCREREQASRRDAEGKLGMEEKQEILRTTDEWRRSVVTGPDGCTVNPTPRPPKRMSSQGFAS